MQTALLGFWHVFTLTTLKNTRRTSRTAKRTTAKKGGWFIGFTPYLLGLSEQKSSSTIVSNPTDSTVDSGGVFSFTAVALTDMELSGTAGNGSQADAQDAAERVCETLCECRRKQYGFIM